MLSGRATRRALSTSVVDDVLAWSALQGHILSGGGRAETLYSASRGFPFDDADLPHHHLRRGTTRDAFDARRRDRGPPAWVVGAWERPAFVGGGAAATRDRVRNLITNTLFVDVRTPVDRDAALAAARKGAPPKSLSDCGDLELRLLARQHAFAGFGDWENATCARHHCVDWNFAPGRVAPRRVPNRWRAERFDGSWTEWSHATDDFGQSYYSELWRRLGTPDAGAVALRSAGHRDAVVVVAGGCFAYAVAWPAAPAPAGEDAAHVAAAVDAALAAGDVAGARGLLSLEAGAGDAATWTVSAALHPWDEGKPLTAALPDLGGAAGGDVALGDARFDVVERPDDDAAFFALLPPEAARL